MAQGEATVALRLSADSVAVKLEAARPWFEIGDRTSRYYDVLVHVQDGVVVSGEIIVKRRRGEDES